MTQDFDQLKHQALEEINRTLAAGGSSRDIFKTIIREAVTLCGAGRGFLILNNIGRVVASFQTKGDKYAQRVVDLVNQTGEALLTIDASTDSRLAESETIVLNDIRSVIATPLRSDGQIIGVVYLDSVVEQRNFKEHDLKLLAALADQASVAFKLATLKLELEREKQTSQELAELAARDSLTGLFNRRSFRVKVDIYLDNPNLAQLSLLMIDIDNFKHYNDRNGHPAGDKLLEGMGRIFGTSLRLHDIAARYGGEEFVIALPETSVDEAKAVARRLMRTVAHADFAHSQDQPGGNLTMSIGIAAYPDHGDLLDELIAAADKAMYSAKRNGKNRICLKT